MLDPSQERRAAAAGVPAGLTPGASSRKRDARRDLRAANATRRFLAVHAEGGVAPPEYDLRRALTERWAPDWWANARNRSWAGHPPILLIRKALGARSTARRCLRPSIVWS